MIFRIVKYASFVLMFSSAVLNAQSFGFGCLGLVGGYAGYTFQVYNPTGLNSYIDDFNLAKQDSISAPLNKFGKAAGFRVGINFFRANLQGLIVTAKGYYQEVKEKTDASIKSPRGITNTTMELKFKTFALGVDLGTQLNKSLTWKVFDLAIQFNNTDFNITYDHSNAHTSILNYKTEKSNIGYSIGTGFIYDLIDQYVSVEGTAAYSFFHINKMKTSDSFLNQTEASSVPMNNFIGAGGFNLVLQINIGFPLL